MTIVPRTSPLSASSALAMTSWYQRGKSSFWGVRIGCFATRRSYWRRLRALTRVRPGVADAAEQALALLHHHRGQLALAGTAGVVVAEGVADLVVDDHGPVVLEAVVPVAGGFVPAREVDGDVAALGARVEAVRL